MHLAPTHPGVCVGLYLGTPDNGQWGHDRQWARCNQHLVAVVVAAALSYHDSQNSHLHDSVPLFYGHLLSLFCCAVVLGFLKHALTTCSVPLQDVLSC